MPRASQKGKSNPTGGGGGSNVSTRTSTYSPQQQVHRVVTKAN